MPIPTNTPIHASYGTFPGSSATASTSATSPAVHPKAEKAKALARRSGGFAKSHWKAIGLVVLGVVAWRAKFLRPLVKTALVSYIAPAAKSMFSHAKPVAQNAFARAKAIRA